MAPGGPYRLGLHEINYINKAVKKTRERFVNSHTVWIWVVIIIYYQSAYFRKLYPSAEKQQLLETMAKW